jgi:hypothetical protein
VGTSVKNDETFKRTLITLSLFLKRRFEVVSLIEGDICALRQVIPYLTPALIDAFENPFRDVDQIANRDSTEKRLDAYLETKNKRRHFPTTPNDCDAHKVWPPNLPVKLGPRVPKN